MSDHRRIPYGVINWAQIVRECPFVDNAAYMRELENVQTPVDVVVVPVNSSTGYGWMPVGRTK